MEQKSDNPGVHIPPPIIFAGIFLLALLIQKYIPIGNQFFYTSFSTIIGFVFLFAGILFVFFAIRRFLITKNTLITVRPATSLQTVGVYSLSRNPIYTGFLSVYSGAGFLVGNWWHFVLFPILLFIVQEYVIKREENYLFRRFGETFSEYKKKVRRWL